MKSRIGINNIFTAFWFLIMLLSGGTLTYFSIQDNLFTTDLIFLAKFFIGLIILITIGLLFYLFYKFRILIIDSHKIISFYPFRLKKEKIELNKIANLKLENFFAFKGIVYKHIKINDKFTTIEISDLEFENFENLISELNIDVNKKGKINFKQAKSNYSNTTFNVCLISGLLIFLIFNTIWNCGLQPFIIVAYIFSNILLLAAIKRLMKYKKILKMNKDNLE